MMKKDLGLLGPARYQGYYFTNCLHVRWACFFHHMGARWRYKTYAVTVTASNNSVRLMPTFLLPEINLWFQIAASKPIEEEREQCRKVRDTSGRAVALFYGPPGDICGELFCWDISDSSGGSSEWEVSLANTHDGDLTLWAETRKSLFYDSAMQHQIENNNGCVKVDLAIEASASLKFSPYWQAIPGSDNYKK